MKPASVATAAMLLAGCAAAPAPRQAAPTLPPAPAASAPHRAPSVANASFEDGMKPGERCALGWDCTMHAGPDSHRFSLAEGAAAAGQRSFCVERVGTEPWVLVTQAFQNLSELRSRRVRVSLAVRVEGATGPGAGPWILAQSRPIASSSRLVTGTSGWQRVAAELLVPADAQVLEFGAALEGLGKACFDDVKLEVL